MLNETKESSELMDMCSPAALDPTKCGKPIKQADAKASLENYFNENGVPDRNDPKHIYGHTFGLKNVKDFLSQIEVHNSTADPKDKVHGIRVYYGKSVRTHFEYPGSEMQRDVFFMPVKKDGSDLHDMTKQLPGGDIILGEGRPCPNECKLTFLDK